MTFNIKQCKEQCHRNLKMLANFSSFNSCPPSPFWGIHDKNVISIEVIKHFHPTGVPLKWCDNAPLRLNWKYVSFKQQLLLLFIVYYYLIIILNNQEKKEIKLHNSSILIFVPFILKLTLPVGYQPPNFKNTLIYLQPFWFTRTRHNDNHYLL